MRPFGVALLDYYRGDHEATISMHIDDAFTTLQPVGDFFREPRTHELERLALDLCRGRVLDVGAGAGIHTLLLQEEGCDVSAIDICPEAVSIMRDRGVADVHLGDIMSLENETFDTLLMMGHNIGMVETLDKLEPFLRHARTITAPDGQILLTSKDVRVTDEPVFLAYQQRNVEAGRFIGEVRISMEYGGIRGPLFSWLHVDSETLAAHAARTGWQIGVVKKQPDGNYMAQLRRD